MPGVDGFMYPNEMELQWSVLIVLYPFITGLVAGGCGTLPVEGDGVVLLQVVQPASLTLAEGTTLQLTARALDKGGNEVPAEIVWRTPDAGVTVEVVGPLAGASRSEGGPDAFPAGRDRFGGLAFQVPDVRAARARLAAEGRRVQADLDDIAARHLALNQSNRRTLLASLARGAQDRS